MNDNHLPNLSVASQLFTVRVWKESLEDGNPQVRVQVKHVLSGAERNFREWSQVVAFITAIMHESKKDLPAKIDQKD